jgi:hypothetical protein
MNKHDNLYNKLFTQKVFEALMSKKGHAVYQTLAEADFQQPHLLSNGEIIHNLYARMSKSYSNEYIYQNTLLNALLLGKHSVRTTTALSRVPVGKAVANFILINGKAVVYEIKSDLDSMDRGILPCIRPGLCGRLRDFFHEIERHGFKQPGRHLCPDKAQCHQC